MTAPRRIVLIRHGEKPTSETGPRGVDANGQQNPNALTVAGWQRAGALVGFLRALTAPPIQLIACRATAQAPSVRAQQTLMPLAEVLGCRIRCDFAHGEEKALASELRAAPGSVVVAWTHRRLPALTRELTGDADGVPTTWPQDRFDIAWVFDGREGELRFSQVPQRLLAGDSAVPLR